ncbi:MAG TPA: hypothetical protein VFP67_00825 [Acidimicrobiia bacterium]|nr:hypothetical protein [Acidimicrobiia bacterium]
MIFGYLDPGSGSMILQAVIGGLAGIGVAFKAYRARRAINKAETGSEAGDVSAVEETTQPAES